MPGLTTTSHKFGEFNMKQFRLSAALGGCLFILSLVSSTAHATAVSGQGTWETTLLPRDLDGNTSTAEAYYDTALGITWLVPDYLGIPLGWDSAKSWAAGLDPYGSGITGWRLPMITDQGNDGCNFDYVGTDCGYNVDTSTSEMAYMYYVTLGDLGYSDTAGYVQSGWGLTNTGWFSYIQSSPFWSPTEDVTNSNFAWMFDFGSGVQNPYYKLSDLNDVAFAWAVHDGDVGVAVSSVPVPAAAWLFGSGLLGLIGVSRRKPAA
jgi:hypothetical protein